jgi:hypothetical protein
MLPNESSSVHFGSPADIFFALLRASRLAFRATFLSRGKGFQCWCGHSIQASRTTFAAAFVLELFIGIEHDSLRRIINEAHRLRNLQFASLGFAQNAATQTSL